MNLISVFILSYFVSEAGNIDPKVYLFEDPQNKDFPLGLIVRSADIESKWAKEALNALISDEYRKKFNDHFQGKYTLFK